MPNVAYLTIHNFSGSEIDEDTEHDCANNKDIIYASQYEPVQLQKLLEVKEEDLNEKQKQKQQQQHILKEDKENVQTLQDEGEEEADKNEEHKNRQQQQQQHQQVIEIQEPPLYLLSVFCNLDLVRQIVPFV